MCFSNITSLWLIDKMANDKLPYILLRLQTLDLQMVDLWFSNVNISFEQFDMAETDKFCVLIICE